MKSAQHRRGYILLPVMITVVVVAAIALLMNSESALESSMVADQHDTGQAAYVAEAGLNHALWQLRQQGCGPYTDFSNQPLGPDKYSTVLTTDLGTTTNYQLSVDQDGWIRNDDTDKTHPSDSKLHIKLENGNIERPVYRYDIASIPAKAPIVSAVAWFYLSKEHPAGAVEIHALARDWSEATANWDLLGDAMDPVVQGSIPAQDTAGVWISVNLTSLMQAWVNGQANHGIALNPLGEGDHGDYASRETSTAPYLEVVTGTPPTPSASLKAVGMLANGVNRSQLRERVSLQQPAPVLYQWQPDEADGIDASLSQSAPDFNFGIGPSLWVRDTAGSAGYHSVLWFDTGRIPHGAVVESAVLELYQRDASNAASEVGLHRLTQSFDEGDDNGASGGGVTWNRHRSWQNWTNPGGDYDPTALATTSIPPNSRDYFQWDITSLVQGWVSGVYPNYGMILTPQAAGTDADFASSDHGDATQRPRLTLTYRCLCGVACVAPQGSGRIVMIGDRGGLNPVPQDREKERIIESWGYDVDLYTDNFIWLIDFDNYDAVYVSETSDPGELSGELDYRSIGIVNEEGDINDDLGFANGKSTATGISLDIIDNDHYLSIPFALGLLPIYDAPMEFITASGSTAAGMQTLGEVSASESLMILDAGATTIGGPAAGRRVSLPLGRSEASDFNWRYLNNNGRLLVQRALAWASGGGVLPPAGALLFVVNNDGNLTSQEEAKKALFESWNYSVNVIDAGDSQADFDAAIAANDVVFIGEDIGSGDLGSKLVAATIGVVSEKYNLADEFGIAAGTYWDSGTSLVIDNSHYITQPLAAGNVTILTSYQDFVYLAGPYAPDLQRLGDNGSGPALAAIEAGTSITPSGNAPGRRVFLPWGNDSFNVNNLSADGLTILQRSLEWAANQPGVLGPIAHWKLDEGSGNVALDSVGGHDGTVADPQWMLGRLNGGLDQSASDNEVVVPHDDSLSLTQKMTLMAWIYPENLDFYDAAIVKAESGFNINYYFGTWENELVFAFAADSFGWEGFYSLGANLQPDNWYHIAASFDNANDTVKLYLDGNLIDTFGTTREPPVDTGDILLGRALLNNERLEGILDDARIYDRVLSDTEIAALATMPGPVAHWKLDETSGLTAVDSAGGHDGTLSNGPAWAAGANGGAVEFSDDSQAIIAAHDETLSINDYLTLTAWVHADQFNSDQVILHKGTSNSDHTFYLGTSNTEIIFGLSPDGGGWNAISSGSSALQLDTWHHVAVTFNNAGDCVAFYLDGVKIAEQATTITPQTNTADVRIGRNHSADGWPGRLDDVRIYDRVLGADEIQSLYYATAPVGDGYHEAYHSWSASNDDSWEVVDLSGFGVPAAAVVEVAVINSNGGAQRWGGVRAVGSSLDRRQQLHEAEGGGVDVMVMHAQTDALSRIEHYSDKSSDLSFILLGFWVGGSFVERWDPFLAPGQDTWSALSLSGFGVSPGSVAEIVIYNVNSSREKLGGVRGVGSGIARRVNLHEAEAGGFDFATMFVNVSNDAGASVELYVDDNSVKFYLSGYWSVAPGIYTETGGVSGQVAAAGTWETTDLSGFGVPANAVAQFLLLNNRSDSENQMGVRATGSTLGNRLLELQEAESGGDDHGGMHVRVDASSQVQWQAEIGAGESLFYPVGWWVLTP